MTPALIVSTAATLSLAILGVAFLVTVYRVVAGPTLPDRVLALDMLVAIAIGFIAAIAVKTGFTLYIDIAISLGLVGFLATVAFARFVLTHGASDGAPSPERSATVVIGQKRRKGPDKNRRQGRKAK
jgi:multicomponent Na+:H+ antiporter subunit F